MAENDKDRPDGSAGGRRHARGRKKALIVSVLLFLLFGGGIFLFFIIQGADDLKDDRMKNFSYGSGARAGVSAFMKRLGFASEEAEFSQAARGRNRARGLASSPLDSAAADISDWMDKGGPGQQVRAPGSRASGASVPRMAAKGSGLARAGGAATKSSAGLSRFGSESDSGNVNISKAGAGAKGSGAKNGTLSSLRNSQAFLGDALRSSSAMGAKTKWGQSFGMGNTGSAGALAYGKSGLSGLDTIKSGEIASLKTTGPKSLKLAEVSPPERDEAAEAKDPALNKMKEAIKDTANPAAGLANSMFSPVARGMGAEDGDKNSTPPKEITDLGNLPQPEGKYCSAAEGCSCCGGATYKDNTPTYQKVDDRWQVTYEGKQTDPDIYYRDVVPLNPGGDPQYGPATSYEGTNRNNMALVNQ